MDEQEEKDLKSKLKAAEDEKKDLESKLKAIEDSNDKDKQYEARKARLIATFDAMEHDDDREKLAKAIRATDDEDEKKALDEAEKEIKSKSKGGQTEDKKDEEQNATIAKLSAVIAEPLVTKMAKARQLKGASDEEITKFKESYEKKSLQAIEDDYNKEKILIEETLSAAEEPEQKHFSFSATENNALNGKSLQEIFEEVEI